jgi:hypothetical protein
MMEREEMLCGYKKARQRQLDAAVQRLQDAVKESLDKEDYGQKKKH